MSEGKTHHFLCRAFLPPGGQEFRAAGFEVMFAPPLRFQIQNSHRLAEILSSGPFQPRTTRKGKKASRDDDAIPREGVRPAGLIITSPSAVEAIRSVLGTEASGIDLEEWPLFVLGPASLDHALEAGFRFVNGFDAERTQRSELPSPKDAEELADVILKYCYSRKQKDSGSDGGDKKEEKEEGEGKNDEQEDIEGRNFRVDVEGSYLLLLCCSR